MPPKPKCSKEQIVNTAYILSKENGLEYVSARTIGSALNISVSPIFTLFSSIDEIKNDVKNLLYKDFIDFCFENDDEFLEHLEKIICFSKREKNVFKDLFIGDNSKIKEYTKNENLINNIKVPEERFLSYENKKKLINEMYIITFGIAVLNATSSCDFNVQDAICMLKSSYESKIAYFKNKDQINLSSSDYIKSKAIYNENNI